LFADHLEQLEPVPADLASGGMALTYEQFSPDEWGLVLYNLDGSGRQVLVPGGTWGTLSPGGDQMAYPSSDGIHVIDLTTRAERVFEQGRNGYDLHWSPDGKQIAFVGETADGVYLIGLDGSSRRQVTDQAYPSVVGWSPDNTKIYVAIPFTGGSAWKVREIDAASGKWTDLFTTENGTRKFLSPTLSPDGQWLAYRGTDNSSLYLVRLDGTDMHLLMIGVGQVIWSRSGWMGVTMLGPDPDQLLLVQPESCRAYLLPSIHGYLMALYIP
jgi:Tol biopolymer transport system component